MLEAADLIAALPAMRGYASRLTRDDAADLVQATALRAWEKRALYVDEGKPNAWLLAVMYRVNADRFRQNRTVYLPIEKAGNVPAIEDTESGVLLADVRKALAAIAPANRRVVLMAAAGERYQTMAEVESVPVGTVCTRLSRGRQRVRELCG